MSRVVKRLLRLVERVSCDVKRVSRVVKTECDKRCKEGVKSVSIIVKRVSGLLALSFRSSECQASVCLHLRVVMRVSTVVKPQPNSELSRGC